MVRNFHGRRKTLVCFLSDKSWEIVTLHFENVSINIHSLFFFFIIGSIFVNDEEEFLQNRSSAMLFVESKGHAMHVFINHVLQGLYAICLLARWGNYTKRKKETPLYINFFCLEIIYSFLYKVHMNLKQFCSFVRIAL